MILSRPALALLLVAGLAASGRGNGWTPLTNQPPCQASTMLLLTDGRVFLQEYDSRNWWLLTPDVNGSYVNGTWSAAASAFDSRLGYASALFADGRVIVSGGEVSSSGSETNHSEIYDPVADSWTKVSPPAGWMHIGDPASSLLADGTFMIGSEADAHTAIYDPKSGAWSAGPDRLGGSSDEESFVLLPDHSVVTADVVAHPGSERYVPSLGTWVTCNSTPVDLVGSSTEIGPAVLMNDGRAFFMGATPHCCLYSFPTVNPGGPGSWVQGVDPPLRLGMPLGAADAPACLLPNGNVLCALFRFSSWGRLPPTYFYEFDGTQWIAAPRPGNGSDAPTDGRMLLLPTGELLYADGTIYAYSCDGAPADAWRPTISTVPDNLLAGQSYTLAGTQLNGLSQAVAYGDDASAATNYPLVRVTNLATRHVFYCRTFDHSTMGVATGSAIVSTHFTVPAGAERGAALLEVVANGIPSKGVGVFIRDPIVIDFDGLASGVTVANQYSSATFSSAPTYVNWTDARNRGSSPPNVLITGPASGGVDGLHDTDVDFSSPVLALTLKAVEVDNVGPAASVNVFESGVLTGSLAIDGSGDPTTPVAVDLTAFHNVTRIELVNITDAGGLAWDDFVFGLSTAASWSNYGAGFAGTTGVPTLTSQSNPVLGTSILLSVGNSYGQTTDALFMAGAQQASIPTSKGGDLLVAPLLILSISLAPTGAQIRGVLPNDSTLCGTSLFAQAIELDPGAVKGVSFSQGLELRFGY